MKSARIGKYARSAVLILMTVILFFPFFWLIRSSFMTTREIFSLPMKWFPETLRFENYIDAFQSAPFGVYFKNTFIVVGLNVFGTIFSSSFVAFGFARLNFKGKNLWFALMISTIMIPYTVLMIPQFIGWKYIGAYNTFFPLFVPSFFGNPFFIFLTRQFYLGIPKEYDEAALADGASYLKIYGSIIVPLSKPVLCTVGVFTFMWHWNDFMGPLIYLKDADKRTVSLGLQTFIGQYTNEWNLLMAAATVITIPMIIVFFLSQRYFIEGITFTGIKA
ncbi:MAG: carbohydrate ABC transporter permease [Clostridiaceae bacterium]|nr:carbohydrate ABC transporter permease [Clostridiaceae bacterium]